MSRKRLTLGTVQFGLPYGVAGRGVPSPEEVDAILETARELGVRSVDTAAAYGASEERVGAFLKRRGWPGGLAICTKLPPLDEAATGTGLEGLVADAVESSLRRLGSERIDCYLIHRASDLSRHGRALVEALLKQRESGRIGRIGVSIYGPDEAALALDHPEITAVQHPLSLLDRRMVSGGRLRELGSRGVVTYARSIFLQGLLVLPPDALPVRVAHARPALVELRRLLADWGVTPLDVALSFVASTQGVRHVVVGVDTPEQLRANAAALARPLPEGLAEALSGRLEQAPPEVVDPTLWPREAP